MPPVEAATAFLARVTRLLGPDEGARVCDAWALADRAHSGQQRQSGEPYVTHPLAVAELLLELLPPDPDVLCAALLHDTVEDTGTSLDSIRRQFGSSVSDIVDGVSKLEQVHVPGSASAKEETLRKLIAAGGLDWRVFAVKLCDRLHNMRTLGAVGAGKQRRVAAETEAVFVPLARYVGLRSVAVELEVLCHHALRPWRLRTIERWTRYKLAADSRRVLPLLSSSALRERISATGPNDLRFHEAVSRSFALLREDHARRALFSTPRFSFDCESIGHAYGLLAILHSHALEVPGSFAASQADGRVSTRVLLGKGGPVAEFACYYPFASLVSWVRSASVSLDGGDFAAVAADSREPGELTRVLRDLLLQKTVAVFTPKGKRLTLPRHSTGLDFAFAVHTDIGLHARGVRQNGVLRDVSTELQSGDIVEVITSNVVLAKPEWESVLRSPRSRTKLRQWLRESRRHNSRALGLRLLNEAISGSQNPLDEAVLYDSDLLNTFGVSSADELLDAVGAGRVSAFAVASRVAGSGADRVLSVSSALDGRGRLFLDGSTSGAISYCHLCYPLPEDAVVAEASAEQTIVHRDVCLARGRSARLAGEHVRLIWGERLIEPVTSVLQLSCDDRTGLLADCARVISDIGLNVVAVNTLSRRTQSERVSAELAFTVLVLSRSKFDRCVDSLRAVANVRDVTRVLRDIS